jgi:hypothetical protein
MLLNFSNSIYYVINQQELIDFGNKNLKIKYFSIEIFNSRVYLNLCILI